jgi:hypothetical protein
VDEWYLCLVYRDCVERGISPPGPAVSQPQFFNFSIGTFYVNVEVHVRVRPIDFGDNALQSNNSSRQKSDFRGRSDSVKQQLANRVNHRCSNPDEGSINVGVAAHITAASASGPRFDTALSPETSQHSFLLFKVFCCTAYFKNMLPFAN